MTDINDLIAQRDELDRQIEAIRTERQLKRNDDWLDIEEVLARKGHFEWSGDDMVFVIGKVTVTMANRCDLDCKMYLGWEGDNYSVTFNDPVPAAALKAMIDELTRP